MEDYVSLDGIANDRSLDLALRRHVPHCAKNFKLRHAHQVRNGTGNLERSRQVNLSLRVCGTGRFPSFNFE